MREAGRGKTAIIETRQILAKIASCKLAQGFAVAGAV